MPAQYDVIVVGGGSAGCVVATRLSEDPNRRVLLLEAGPDPQPLPEIVANASLQTRLLLESPYIELYPTRRKIDGSEFYSLAGRIMGGGSSVNVMAITRPMQHDLDSWAARGNPDWSYEKLLPVMKRIESDQDFPDSSIHGADGPLYLKRPFRPESARTVLEEAFIERARSLGLPFCADINGPAPLGLCPSPYCVKDGKRQSTTVAYLDQARGRPNLEIIAEATVLSLGLAGSRVESVRYEKDGQVQTVNGDTVVLSAGVYHTPQILMLSGIGPVAELERLGIPVALPLEGVGRNYQDHAVVFMTFEGPIGVPGTEIVPRFRLIIKSDPDLPAGNLHVLPRLPTEVSGIKRMMPISIHLLEQRNRGRVTLASTDPAELPIVDAGLLEHPDDLAAMETAMQFVYDFVQHDSLKPYYGPLVQPGPKESWTRFAAATHDSYHHGVGTCQMGPASDPQAVVDPKLRVHGMDNLWIADASIMPTVTRANTNLTAILIGEVASDCLKAAS